MCCFFLIAAQIEMRRDNGDHSMRQVAKGAHVQRGARRTFRGLSGQQLPAPGGRTSARLLVDDD